MADFRRGLTAGTITGIVYVVVYAVFGVVFGRESLHLTNLLDAAGLTPVVSPVYPGLISSCGIFSSILRGVIFGVIFVGLYGFLPSTSSIVKAVVLSAVLWAVTVVEVSYTMPEWHGIRGTYYGGTVNLSSLSLVLVGILFALLFGALTGLLWDRLRTTRRVETRESGSVLLVGFILGGAIWVLFALMFLLGRVPLAVVIGSEFWWEQLVTRFVVFMGSPGWVLALVALRKTSRGESGFKWAMYGGVMMALTGVMLLPGALTIAGGVLSRRESVSECRTGETER